MRRILAAVMLMGAITLATAASAQEGDRAVEVSLNYGTEAFDGLGGQFGITAGYGYEFRNNLQGRVDISYFRSSTSEMDEDVSGTRVPVDFGVRYYYPLTKVDRDLTAYGQGGLELSFDDWEPAAGVPSRSRTRFGALIGAGAEYALDDQYSAVAHMQYHIISDSFFSLGIGMAYHF